MTETEISILAHRYYDPLIKLYNYYRFNDDIRALWEKGRERGMTITQQPSTSPVSVHTLRNIQVFTCSFKIQCINAAITVYIIQLKFSALHILSLKFIPSH